MWKKKLLIPELSKNEFTFENIDKNVRSSVAILNKKINQYKEALLDGNELKIEDKQLVSLEYFGLIKVEKKVLVNFFLF